jgi:hypothetical protein
MKAAIVLIPVICSLPAAAAAQPDEASAGPALAVESPGKTHVIGGHFSLGMANAVGEECEGDCRVRFAGGGGVYYDLYLSDVFALEIGVGLLGRGWEADGLKWKLLFLSVPLGVKLDLQGFRIGVAVALEVGLRARTDWEYQDQEDLWEYYDRLNFGPRVSLGYAIPVGPIAIVPGIDWSMHVLSAGHDDRFIEGPRFMNIMFNVGVELGL